jgi:hypothetical protein
MDNADYRLEWKDEDTYWRSNFKRRPYAATSEFDYNYFQPGYRYGYDAAHRFKNSDWDDIEPELERGWTSYEHRGESTWEHVKLAVRDAWDRITGKHPVGAP